ncbi:MAG: hypothetical protein PHN74_00145 [Candidatus Pacebacteria bacterium]|nr:hypothetical protein [Candidatus Paceibacterota bacterium]
MKKSLILVGSFICLVGIFGFSKSANAWFCWPSPVDDCNVQCRNLAPNSDLNVYTINADWVGTRGHTDGRGEGVVSMRGLATETYFIKDSAGNVDTLAKVTGSGHCANVPPYVTSSIALYSAPPKYPLPAGGVVQGSAVYYVAKVQSVLGNWISGGINFNFSSTISEYARNYEVVDDRTHGHESNACFSCGNNISWPSCAEEFGADYTEIDRKEFGGFCHCEKRITCRKSQGFQDMAISGYTNAMINTPGNIFTGTISATDSAGNTTTSSATTPVIPPPQEIKATGTASCSCSNGVLTTSLNVSGTQGVEYAILRSDKVVDNLAERTSNYYIPGNGWWGPISSCVNGVVKTLLPIENGLPSGYQTYSIFKDGAVMPGLSGLSSAWNIPIGTGTNQKYCCGTDWFGNCNKYCNCPSYTTLPSSSNNKHKYSAVSWGSPTTVLPSHVGDGNAYGDQGLTPETGYVYLVRVPATDREGFTTTYSDPITVTTPACVAPVVVPLPSCAFSASPTTVPAHSISKISWDCQNSINCSLYEGTSVVASGIKKDYTANIGTDDKTYKLSCTGDGGSKDFTLSVKVSSVQYQEVAP